MICRPQVMFPVPSPSPALPRKAESKWPELVRCIPARSGHLIHTCVWTVNSKHGLVCSVHRSALGFMGRVHSTQPAPSPAAPPKGRDSSQGAMKIWELQQRRNALSQKANTVLAEKEREANHNRSESQGQIHQGSDHVSWQP